MGVILMDRLVRWLLNHRNWWGMQGVGLSLMSPEHNRNGNGCRWGCVENVVVLVHAKTISMHTSISTYYYTDLIVIGRCVDSP